MEENNRQNIPKFCRNQCGFYGSPSYDYFCSKCHRSSAAQRDNSEVINRMTADITPKISTPELRKTSRPASRCESPKPKNDQPVITVTTDDNSENRPSTHPPPSDLPKSVDKSPNEPEADAEVAALGLPDTLLPNLNDDNKNVSPASSCSSTGESDRKRPICAVCRKRVGLTGFKCRCDGLFCSAHRYAELHDCSFDYRVSGQEEIRRSNPQIVCEKVRKI